MQHWNAWFSDRDDDDNILDPAHWRLEEVLETQQRFWTECMEASQIWLSWWVSTLPPMNWPPTGMVLPPAEVKRAAHKMEQTIEEQGAKLSAAPETASAAARKQRSSSTATPRHH